MTEIIKPVQIYLLGLSNYCADILSHSYMLKIDIISKFYKSYTIRFSVFQNQFSYINYMRNCYLIH